MDDALQTIQCLVIPILIVLSPVLIGLAVGQTGRIPRLRRIDRASALIRAVHVALGSILAGAVMVEIVLAVLAIGAFAGSYFMATLDLAGRYSDGAENHRPEIRALAARYDAATAELMLREINPLPGPTCYTTADACQLTDQVLSEGKPEAQPGAKLNPFDGLTPISLILLVAPLVISGSIAATMIWRFTRPEQTEAVTKHGTGKIGDGGPV